jgi:hypothetical protein
MDPKPAEAPAQKPWGYSWIAVAIIAFVLAYTFIRLQYARPDAPSNPFEENEQVKAGPLAGNAPWRTVKVAALAAQTAEGFSSLTLNYLPMAAGVPREFGVILPKDAVWPSVVEAVACRVIDGNITLVLDVAWPEKGNVPSGWFGFARGELDSEKAGGSARLLSQIRSDLERSIFLTSHVILMPEPGSPQVSALDAPRRVSLEFPLASLPTPTARIVLPTRRGLAFVELPSVP